MQLRKRSQFLVALLVLAAYPLIVWMVYGEGMGTESSTHFFYLPIITAAIFLGDYWAMGTAIAAGVLTLWVPGRPASTHQLPDFMVRILMFYVIGILAARLSSIIRQRAAENSSLLDVSRAINSSLRLDEVLSQIAAKAVELTDAQGCSILLLDTARQMLVFRASCGLSEDYTARYPVRVSESKLDQAALEGRHVASGQERGFALGREDIPGAGITSILCVPVMGRNEPLGVIRIYTKPGYQFSRSERQLLGAFAHQAAIAIENANLFEGVRRNYSSTVRALARAIEAKDPATLGHSERATELALRVGEYLKLSKEQMERLEFGGLLHDIGKIGLDNASVLPNAGSPEELIVSLHPLIGKSILEPVEFLQPALEVVLYHHERFDGGGYPEGLAGERIPYLARLFAVANVYDSITSGSQEHNSLTPGAAIARLRRMAGVELDPALVEAFAAVVTKPYATGTRCSTLAQ